MKKMINSLILVIFFFINGGILGFNIAREDLPYPKHVEGFPILATNTQGNLWMAKIERLTDRRLIRICQVINNREESVCILEPDRLTGIAPPAMAGLGKGCIVTFPVEQDDKWQIAYAIIKGKNSSDPEIHFIDCDGNANINPAIAVSGESAWIVWESNAGKARGIYACQINKNGIGKKQRISVPDVNSYNPSIVSLPDGSLFSVWDSYRDKSADIYGAWFKNGKWQEEQRLTSDPRIERHPFLSAKGNEIWMTWQAQSYGHTTPVVPEQKPIRLNNIEEQRIVVAKMVGERLEVPIGFFKQISTYEKKLLRPGIAFDATGKLWLSARESMGQLRGWRPVIWSYGGSGWSEQVVLLEHQGRWNSVSMAISSNQITVAIQYDNLPNAWGVDRRKGLPNWNSGIILKSIPLEDNPEKTSIKTKDLIMPDTDFSLHEKTTLCGTDLPVQHVSISGRELTLFWGTLHEHSAISICSRDKNPPGHDVFANLRDIEKLDFCALTDHGSDIDRYVWDYNGEQTRNNYDPGRFITFPGLEWSSSMHLKSKGYGHFNLIYLDPYFSEYYDNNYDDITPAELWKKIGDAEFISIPHQLADWDHMVKFKGENGNPPVDWNYVDEKLQPVAEIFQLRESYEYFGCPRQAPQGAPFQRYYIQDAWARGIIIGVIASPDHGGGLGKAGVWAEDLSRESIFKAIQARHTFGTSGQKIGLLFQSGEAIMGDKVKWDNEPITFNIKAVALNPVKELVIFRNNEVVYRIEPNQKEIEMQWTDENPVITKYAWYKKNNLWYYVRIQTEDEELAWSSPIWFVE